MPRIQYKGIADAQMPSAVPADRYDLRCVKSTYVESNKKGNPMVTLECEVLNHPEADTVYHYITFPKGGDAKKDNRVTASTKRICEMFAVEFDDEGFDSDDFQGKEAHNVLLSVEPFGDSGKLSNKIDVSNT